MKHTKLFLAFALGCVTAIALGFGGNATTGRAGTSTVSALERRVLELELAANRGQLGQKVIAPFELRDRFGKRIFYVDEKGADLYGGGKAVAEMGLGENGGFLSAVSGTGNSTVNFGVGSKTIGLVVLDKGVSRISLGKDLGQGNYRLKFLSGSSQNVAAIGESTEHLGAALVYDTTGNLKARMAIGTDGKGVVDVLGGKQLPIAQLTESENGGGKLWLGNASGVGMVEAGDAGCYGIVKAGPRGFEFIPTPGLALPGSVIVGKR